ncbi:MAG: hypothetical protein ACE5IR_22835 [bacterium]
MPVYKYKNFEEAEEHLKQLQSNDPLERLSKLEAIMTALKPRRKIQRGIFKFKTHEEANKHRERW